MKKKWIIGLIISLVAALIITAVVLLYIMPYVQAESRMQVEGGMILRQNADGSVELSWPASETDYYHVSISVPAEHADGEETILHEADVMRGTSYVLPRLYPDNAVTIRVNTMVKYRVPGSEKVRHGVAPLEVTLNLVPPAVKELQCEVDPESDTVLITCVMTEGDIFDLYRINEQGERVFLTTLTKNQTELLFGDGKDADIPAHGEDCVLVISGYRKLPGIVYYGKEASPVTLVREDFLGRQIVLEYEKVDENQYMLRWNESKGEQYLVQRLSGDTGLWETIHVVERDGERNYTTEHLKPFRTVDYRVVSSGGQTMPDSELAAMSDGMTIQTEEALLYSTIWPLKKLNVYAKPGDENPIGTVEAGSTHCVLGETEGMFRIRFGEDCGYIDSNQCLINLPEYLGNLCSYNITNSYRSIYKVQKYDIPKITGKVIKGYEKVRLGDGSYLVPLLYPTAKKLMAAAIDAREQGYRLKIYDAFRPNKATISIYDLTEEILEDPVPGSVRDPSPEDPERLLTYERAMTDDTYALNYFLAKGMSMHNVGVAVDITIEELDTGREQNMQSAMHDLSYRSVLHRNNGNANLLAEIMKNAGFGGLVSEWWHFQDNDIYKEVSPAPLYGGVSAQGWMRDDFGWRWRYADGTFAASTKLVIQNVEYLFDEAGYVLE